VKHFGVKALLLLTLCALGVALSTAGVLGTLRPTSSASQPVVEAAASGPSTVKGTLAYLETGPSVAVAVVIAQLVEFAVPNTPAVVLGEQVVYLDRLQAPVEFEIGYDPASIRSGGAYGVRASIMVDGEPVFRGATGLVLPGHQEPLQVVLTKVAPWSALDYATSSGRLVRFSR
jgi:uncharacterized lipoprotein YbaY